MTGLLAIADQILKDAAQGIEPAQDPSVRQNIGTELLKGDKPWLLGVFDRTKRLLHHLVDRIL